MRHAGLGSVALLADAMHLHKWDAHALVGSSKALYKTYKQHLCRGLSVLYSV